MPNRPLTNFQKYTKIAPNINVAPRRIPVQMVSPAPIPRANLLYKLMSIGNTETIVQNIKPTITYVKNDLFFKE